MFLWVLCFDLCCINLFCLLVVYMLSVRWLAGLAFGDFVGVCCIVVVWGLQLAALRCFAGWLLLIRCIGRYASWWLL